MPDSPVREELRAAGLFPFQVEFVKTLLSSERPLRVLLTSSAGMGKTVAIAAALKVLAARKPSAPRYLIVVPANLQAAWESILRRFGSIQAQKVDPPAYRRLEALTEAGVNPWSKYSCLVTSVDFLKSRERFQEALSIEWDCVVIDEAHLCSAGTQRGGVARAIWNSNNVAIAVASSALAYELDWIIRHPSTRVIRWTASDSVGWDGRPLLSPNRRVDVTSVRLSSAESAFVDRVLEFSGRLEAGTQRSAFWGHLLRRRLASSLYAVEQSLRRYAADSVERKVADFDQPDEWAVQEFSVPAYEDVNLLFSVEDCHDVLRLLEDIESDGKWTACARLLERLEPGTRRSVVLFTDFADTAEYVADLARSRDWPTYLVTGRQPIEERWWTVEEVRQEQAILVLTSAVTEGVDVAFCDQAIHYDLPWDHIGLARRFARLERISSEHSLISHHFLVDEVTTKEASIWQLQDAVRQHELA